LPILQDSHSRNLGLMNFVPPILLGFLATSFQIFLLREFSVHFYGNEMSFGFILAAWLFWGGIGSLAASRFRFNLKRLPAAYLAVIVLFCLSLIGLRFSRFFLGTLPGEITGIVPILGFSLASTFFISLPLGVLFVFNSHLLQGDVARVYLFESLGAAISGLLVYLLLIPFFSNWQGAVIVGIIALFLIFVLISRGKNIPSFLTALFFLGGFVLSDLPSQKVYWKPFSLIQSKDTPYGKLQVIKTKEQISVYGNGLLVYSYPDPA
jgi:spermidine synthase